MPGRKSLGRRPRNAIVAGPLRWHVPQTASQAGARQSGGVDDGQVLRAWHVAWVLLLEFLVPRAWAVAILAADHLFMKNDAMEGALCCFRASRVTGDTIGQDGPIEPPMFWENRTPATYPIASWRHTR